MFDEFEMYGLKTCPAPWMEPDDHAPFGFCANEKSAVASQDGVGSAGAIDEYRANGSAAWFGAVGSRSGRDSERGYPRTLEREPQPVFRATGWRIAPHPPA